MGGLLLLCLSMAVLPSSIADCGRQVTIAFPDIQEGLVAVGEFPWVVFLQDQHKKHLAVGSILSKHWILSVASSFQDSQALVSFLRDLFAGSLPPAEEVNQNIETICFNKTISGEIVSKTAAQKKQAFALVGVTSSKKPTVVPISTVIPHSGFDEITFIHNIALLKIATPLQFSKEVQPICIALQTPPESALGSCQVSGWMHSQAGGDSLRKLSLVDVDSCPLYRVVTTECASHRDGGNVPGCLGYPGNPIMCQALDTTQWVLKGMLSKGGAKCYGPFLYTRISLYSDWILTTTAKQGLPVSPILVGRHVALVTKTKPNKGIAIPWMEAKAVNLTLGPEGQNIPQVEQPQEDDEETPELVRPQGRILPVYYDYYGGEIFPISTAMFNQPWGCRGTIPASFLLYLLTFWVTT